MKKGDSTKRRRAVRQGKYIRDFGGHDHIGTVDAELLGDLAAIRENIERLQALKDRGASIDEDALKDARWQAIQIRNTLNRGRSADAPRATKPQVTMTQIREAETRAERLTAEARQVVEVRPSNLLEAPAPAPATESVPADVPSPPTDMEPTLQ